MILFVKGMGVMQKVDERIAYANSFFVLLISYLEPCIRILILVLCSTESIT